MLVCIVDIGEVEGARQYGGQQLHAAASGSGYGPSCPEGIPVEFALLSILAAFGVAFGILYRALTLLTGRRAFQDVGIVGHIADSLWHGKRDLIDQNRCYEFDIWGNVLPIPS